KGSGAVTDALSLGARLENAAVAVARYLGKFFAPFDLAVLYPHPGDWPMAKVVACVVIILAISALALAQRRRRPWVAVGWLWFLGTLVPVIGLVQVGDQSMADRYTYVPLIGVFIMIAWSLPSTVFAPSNRGRVAAAAVVALILAALGAVTFTQV